MPKAVSTAFRVSEAAWLASVLEIAEVCGYTQRFHDNATNARRKCPGCGLPLHTPRNRRGFPDLVLARPPSGNRPGRLIFAELKAEDGLTTPELWAWLNALRLCGQEAYVWRPSQAQEVADILSADGPPL